MNNAVGFVCLVTVAVMIGETLTKSCDCEWIQEYDGCKLSSNNDYIQGHVCRCQYVSGTPNTCSGKFVQCYLPGSRDCSTTDNTFYHCLQGIYKQQGNCCGYYDSWRYNCKDLTRGVLKIKSSSATKPAKPGVCPYTSNTGNGIVFACNNDGQCGGLEKCCLDKSKNMFNCMTPAAPSAYPVGYDHAANALAAALTVQYKY